MEDSTASKRPGISVPAEVKNRLAKWVKQNDEELGKTASRILTWFVEADPLVQAVVTSKPVQRIDALRAQALRAMADQVERAAGIQKVTKPISSPAGTEESPQKPPAHARQ